MIATLPLIQLFFFHILLIKKGISTYDYIIALREQEHQGFGGPRSPQMSPASSLTGLSRVSSFNTFLQGAWCTPPRLFVENQACDNHSTVSISNDSLPSYADVQIKSGLSKNPVNNLWKKMGDLDGGDVVNPPNRVRKRSKRIMVNTYFYQFSNTIDNPVDCDEEVSVTKSDTPGTMDKPDVSKKSKKLKVTRPEDYVDALVKEDLVIGTPVSKKDLIYDSDFEDPMKKVTVSDLPKKKGLVRVKKESGIKVNGIKNVKYRNTGILKTRTSPKTFQTIGILNVNQKNAVREIGLERLLDMKLDGIPNKLGFFLVDNFDPKKMVLNATKGKIPITEQSVHNILGLPIGGIDLMSTNPDTRYGNIKTIWKKQFIKDRVRPTDLMYEIIKTNDHGFYFKLNFLVLVINVLAECSRTGYCNIGFLSHIKGVDMISKVDWCKYVIDCLEMSKCKWRRNSDLSFYAGSITYLTMLYVESTKCASDPGEDSHMPLTKWTLNLLRKRQVVEQKNGGIGSSMLREADPVPSPDQCKESSNAHEENMHPSDNTKQVCLKRLDHKISQATDLLLDVDSLMAEAREMFPGTLISTI